MTVAPREELSHVDLVRQDREPARLPLELVEKILRTAAGPLHPQKWTKKQLLDLSLLCKSLHQFFLRMLYANLTLEPGVGHAWIAEKQLIDALRRDRSKGEMVQTVDMSQKLVTLRLQERPEVRTLFSCIRPSTFTVMLDQTDLPVLDLLNASRVRILSVTVGAISRMDFSGVTNHPWVTLLIACANTIETLGVDPKLLPRKESGEELDVGMAPLCPKLHTVINTDCNLLRKASASISYSESSTPFTASGTRFLHGLLVKYAKSLRYIDICLFKNVIATGHMQHQGHLFTALSVAAVNVENPLSIRSTMLSFLQAAPALAKLVFLRTALTNAKDRGLLPDALVERLEDSSHFAALQRLDLSILELPIIILSDRYLAESNRTLLKGGLRKLKEVCKRRKIALVL